MPALAAWLFSLLGQMVAFFASAYGKRVAVILAITALVTGVYTVFFLALRETLIALSLVAPSGLTIALSWFVPSALDKCLAARISVEVLVWVVQWKNMLAINLAKAV